MDEGDRCSLMCMDEHPEVCPGTTIHLAIGETVMVADTTAGASDKFLGAKGGPGIGNCGNYDFPGPDLVYAVMPEANGTVTAVLDASYSDSFVHVRPGCPSSKGEELKCTYRSGPGTTTISFSVVTGTTYFVAADSWDNKSGGFKLALSLVP